MVAMIGMATMVTISTMPNGLHVNQHSENSMIRYDFHLITITYTPSPLPWTLSVYSDLFHNLHQ